MSKIEVRPGGPGDCDIVAAMVRELAQHAGVEARVTGAALEREAFGPRPTIALLLAEDDWNVLGCLVHQDTFSSWRGANGLFVVDLFVRADQRGRGIGLALMREAARIGRAKGAAFMRLDVEPDNRQAIRFYRGLGFRTVGLELQILEGEGMEALAEG